MESAIMAKYGPSAITGCLDLVFHDMICNHFILSECSKILGVWNKLQAWVYNSVDFVPYKDGKITIRTQTTYTKQTNSGNPNCITFTIESNGSGIPAEKLIIFSRNFVK